MSNAQDIPVWEKYTLTIEEASKYFRIGENKLRRLAEENKDAGWQIYCSGLQPHPKIPERKRYFCTLLLI